MSVFSELLRDARRGEPVAVAELHRQFGPAVLARVRARLAPLLRRRYDTLDLGQSVFADVLTKLPRFEDRGEEAFQHWLLIQAENKVVSKLRRQLGRAGGRREVTLPPERGRALLARGPGPEELAARADERERLCDVLRRMLPHEREVLTLRTQRRLTFPQIAEHLELASPNVARMRYVRALIALRKRWKSS